MTTIRLGEFAIDRALEFEGPFLDPAEFFPDYDPAAAIEGRDWIGRLFDTATGHLVLSFHTFVLRTTRHTVLIDTCFGNDKERPLRPLGHHARTDYLANLKRLGVNPAEVDVVMCTHLHWDHVGWNTQLRDGQWVPTFPNARHVIARREYEHWDKLHARGEAAMHGLAFADSVLPIVRAEKAMLVEQDFELERGVWLEAASGHTPGNVVINVESRGKRGVFAGDVLHSPLQLLRPDWSTRACTDPVLSRSCRRAFIEQHADTGNLVMPAHFPAPSAGRIESSGKAFRFVS